MKITVTSNEQRVIKGMRRSDASESEIVSQFLTPTHHSGPDSHLDSERVKPW